ncbi:rhodanese-like domain-containing protein [Prescottella subtropica]|uniref:rhodanese-like domain-containing protein n=1 Tax=Prescottella subtropica TaxID=2545757 RepID=UPI001F4FEE55|nr:rhodanese-like domain-containing protein [Prescottella subtropica]
MSSPHVPTVSVTELPAESSEAVVLLDVREDDEWALGRAPGAQHIPLVDIPARADEIDIDAEVYVVCRQGGRSILAVEYLNNIGYDAYNVSGGMVAWQQAGLPLTSDGDPGSAKIY